MRFEITLRDAAAIPSVAALLVRHDIRAVNVTDTAKDVDPVDIATRLLAAKPDLDVMVHLAAKHSADAASFAGRLSSACAAGIKKVLIVSGHPRPAFGSIDALEVLDAEGCPADAYCVYNPFLEGEALAEEDARLAAKLRSGTVRGICLQIGTDLAAIARSAEKIRAQRFDIELLGSVPVPTEAMLTRFREKPLFGVSLPEAYLDSIAAAEGMTRDLLGHFDAYDIEPLFFFAELDETSIAKAMALSGR